MGAEADLPDGVVAALSKETTEDLATLQRKNEELSTVITYLESGVLPPDDDPSWSACRCSL